MEPFHLHFLYRHKIVLLYYLKLLSVYMQSQTCKTHTSGSCKNGSKCRFIHHQQTTPSASPTEPPVACATIPIVSPLKLETATTSTITFTSTDWSPQDDGIEITLPPSTSSSTVKATSREEVDAYIHSILHGPPRTKRLQVFADICPEQTSRLLNKPSKYVLPNNFTIFLWLTHTSLHILLEFSQTSKLGARLAQYIRT